MKRGEPQFPPSTGQTLEVLARIGGIIQYMHPEVAQMWIGSNSTMLLGLQRILAAGPDFWEMTNAGTLPEPSWRQVANLKGSLLFGDNKPDLPEDNEQTCSGSYRFAGTDLGRYFEALSSFAHVTIHTSFWRDENRVKDFQSRCLEPHEETFPGLSVLPQHFPEESDQLADGMQVGRLIDVLDMLLDMVIIATLQAACLPDSILPRLGKIEEKGVNILTSTRMHSPHHYEEPCFALVQVQRGFFSNEKHFLSITVGCRDTYYELTDYDRARIMPVPA